MTFDEQFPGLVKHCDMSHGGGVSHIQTDDLCEYCLDKQRVMDSNLGILIREIKKTHEGYSLVITRSQVLALQKSIQELGL